MAVTVNYLSRSLCCNEVKTITVFILDCIHIGASYLYTGSSDFRKIFRVMSEGLCVNKGYTVTIYNYNGKINLIWRKFIGHNGRYPSHLLDLKFCI